MLRDKAFNSANHLKYDVYQHGLPPVVYKAFNKKLGGVSASATHKDIRINSETQKLAEELHKPIIKKSKESKVYSSFKDNIWGSDLANMQLISK